MTQEFSIVNLKESPGVLSAVIELGNANREYLGLLPYAAYEFAANAGNILAAITQDRQLLGYILFRIVKSKGRAAITHLCVDEKSRGKGVGKRLLEKVISETKHLDGIIVLSKRKYPSNKFWPKHGFRALGEKPGRGRRQEPLTRYWYEHKAPPLLQLVKQKAIDSKAFVAAIDMNLFIPLFENQNHPLLADWLFDDLLLVVTPEIGNEINRDDDPERRRRMWQFWHSFVQLSPAVKEAQRIEASLKSLYEPVHGERDESDIRQVAAAIAADADFFVTRDAKLLNRLQKPVRERYGLQVIQDDQLILHIDRYLESATYQPQRLAGTQIRLSRMEAEQANELAEVFHRYSGEKQKEFRERLREFMSNPRANLIHVVASQDHGLLAAFTLRARDKQTLEVPLFRVISDSLSPALDSRVLSWIVDAAVRDKYPFVYVSDDMLSERTKKALRSNSFFEGSNGWLKVNLLGILGLKDVEVELEALRGSRSDFSGDIEATITYLTTLVHLTADADIIELEKAVWPAKLADVSIPSFIVPIAPQWAAELFDHGLGSQTLFGSNPNLILKPQNVYYRSAHTRLPSEHSRIMWYVSHRKGFRNVKAVRACSYVEESIVQPVHNLFKQFNDLGVYQWRDALETASGDPNKPILAFRFGRTETLNKPIKLETVKRITGRNSAPFAPQPLTNAQFLDLYRSGLGTAGG